jgi:hypothetical protein
MLPFILQLYSAFDVFRPLSTPEISVRRFGPKVRFPQVFVVTVTNCRFQGHSNTVQRRNTNSGAQAGEDSWELAA